MSNNCSECFSPANACFNCQKNLPDKYWCQPPYHYCDIGCLLLANEVKEAKKEEGE